MFSTAADTSLEPCRRVELLLQVCWKVLELNNTAKVVDLGGLEVGSGLVNEAGDMVSRLGRAVMLLAWELTL